VDFDATDQLLIIHSPFVKKCIKMGTHEAVCQLFIDFKKAYDSIRTEVLYDILIEFGIPIKLARLIKTCLN
jgi:hypothetical protein